MAGRKKSTPVASPVQNDDDEAGYERSTIQFPYFDLAESVRIAQAISNEVGNGDCSDDQLGVWIKLSHKSSGFRSRISAARMFGIIEPGKSNDHRLTELGLKVVDESRRRAGKADAFLKVELFHRIYEQWKGMQLPPAAALERQMKEMGVAEKQTARARQVFERSAQEAGFFEHGNDKLVRPGVKGGESKEPPADPRLGGGGGGSGGAGGGGGELPPDIDPIIMGLLRRLPKAGAAWPEAQREAWLNLLKGSFGLIYKPDGTDG